MKYHWVELAPALKTALTQLSLKVEVSEKKRFRVSQGWPSLVALIRCAQQSSDDYVKSAYSRVVGVMSSEIKREMEEEGVLFTDTSREAWVSSGVGLDSSTSGISKTKVSPKVYRGVVVEQSCMPVSSNQADECTEEVAQDATVEPHRKKMVYRGQVKWV